MIFDTLDHAARYSPLHPLLPTAFAWLSRLGPRQAAGRFLLDGDRLFANVDEAMTEPREARRFETHRKYIDLQVSLEGGEVIEWATPGSLPTVIDFQPGGDIAFHAPPPLGAASLCLTPGRFAIFFPGEPHRPLCALEGGGTQVRKVIVKIAQ